jgi:hypothetical protein
MFAAPSISASKAHSHALLLLLLNICTSVIGEDVLSVHYPFGFFHDPEALQRAFDLKTYRSLMAYKTVSYHFGVIRRCCSRYAGTVLRLSIFLAFSYIFYYNSLSTCLNRRWSSSFILDMCDISPHFSPLNRERLSITHTQKSYTLCLNARKLPTCSMLERLPTYGPPVLIYFCLIFFDLVLAIWDRIRSRIQKLQGFYPVTIPVYPVETSLYRYREMADSYPAVAPFSPEATSPRIEYRCPTHWQLNYVAVQSKTCSIFGCVEIEADFLFNYHSSCRWAYYLSPVQCEILRDFYALEDGYRTFLYRKGRPLSAYMYYFRRAKQYAESILGPPSTAISIFIGFLLVDLPLELNWLGLKIGRIIRFIAIQTEIWYTCFYALLRNAWMSLDSVAQNISKSGNTRIVFLSVSLCGHYLCFIAIPTVWREIRCSSSNLDSHPFGRNVTTGVYIWSTSYFVSDQLQRGIHYYRVFADRDLTQSETYWIPSMCPPVNPANIFDYEPPKNIVSTWVYPVLCICVPSYSFAERLHHIALVVLIIGPGTSKDLDWFGIWALNMVLRLTGINPLLCDWLSLCSIGCSFSSYCPHLSFSCSQIGYRFLKGSIKNLPRLPRTGLRLLRGLLGGILWGPSGILRYESKVSGQINSIFVSAFPDYGSELDIVSETFVKRHGLNVNRSISKLIRLPNGTATKTAGTVLVNFKFDNEGRIYRRVFNVMQSPLHDVILGSPFLKLTKTLTRNSQRLKKKVVFCMPKMNLLRLLGSPKERLHGLVNGFGVAASPDTGAQVNVISKAFAKRIGANIKMDNKHKSALQFVDGSCAMTSGMVTGVEWKFARSSADNGACKIDFHVLDGLSCDVILSERLLSDTRAFELFQDCFRTCSDDEECIEVGMIDWKDPKTTSAQGELFRFCHRTFRNATS